MEQEFKDWIGRSVTRKDVVTERLLAEYRATMSPFLFETQRDICPPGLHFGLAPANAAAPSDTGPDGAERKGLFLPPIPLPRRMWAGGVDRDIPSAAAGSARLRRISTHRGHPLASTAARASFASSRSCMRSRIRRALPSGSGRTSSSARRRPAPAPACPHG